MTLGMGMDMDMIENILLCLPVHTLLRLRLVCRRFRVIIDSAHFIHSHASIRKKKLIVCDLDKRNFRVVDLEEGFPELEFVELTSPFKILVNVEGVQEFRMPAVLAELRTCNFYAECDSLVIAGTDIYNMWVWNPWTMRCPNLRKLPQSNTNEELINGVGLGHSNNAYKILVVRSVEYFRAESWILTLRTNVWRRLEEIVFIPTVFSRISFHQGCLVILSVDGEEIGS